MDSKIEKKLVKFVKALSNDDEYCYICYYNTSGEEETFIKKVDVVIKTDDKKWIASVEFNSYMPENPNEECADNNFCIIADNLNVTIYKLTSEPLWELLVKFINKKWSIDNIVATYLH